MLNEFFNTPVFVENEDYEYYNDEDEVGTVISILYITVSMTKHQFKKFDGEEKIKGLHLTYNKI